MKEKTARWTWNYFSTETKIAFPKFNFPDDLDDTSICLSALYMWNKDLFTGEAWAQITQTLIEAESEAGGPYHTWITNSPISKWRDIDIAVNANISYFLSLAKIEVSKLHTYLFINLEQPISPYYPHSLMPLYYLSFSIQNKDIKFQCDKNSVLQHALALSVAIQTRKSSRTIKTLIEKMVELYSKKGLQSEPFCLDPARESQKYFCGSEALTAVFVLEAISLYSYQNTNKTKKDTLYFIIKQSKKFIPENIINASLGKRTREVIDYPVLFAEALGLPRSTGQILAHANFFGWVAYYITDCILDEGTQTKNISLAHISLRKMYLIYSKYVAKNNLRFCYRLLTKMDYVQYKDEISPNKSIGQALPFIILLFLKGFSSGSPQVKNMLKFWRHYLSARQLSDDAHDWKEDLEKNISNEAILMIKKHTLDPLCFSDVFWSTTFSEIIKEINLRLNIAQSAIESIEKDTGVHIFSDLIKQARMATKQAVIEKESLENFAHHYNSPQTPVSPEHTDQ